MISEKLSKKYRTWVEVDRGAIRANYTTFRGLLSGKTALMAVVKSNAYGHGLVEYARELEKLGIDWIGVDSTVEAMVLRKEGVTKPILALGYTLQSKFIDAARLGIHMSISTFEQLEVIRNAQLDTKLAIHVKVDTGMHRQGFMWTDRTKLFETLGGMKQSVQVAGLFTHFAAAKDPSDTDKTKDQIRRFEAWKKECTAHGYAPLCHTSASSGTILYPEAHYDLVRVGISIYGLWPSPKVRSHAEDMMNLVPALSWKTIISEVKHIPKGESVGYDFTETLTRDSLLAVCPVGYWHGYLRAFSSKASVLVKGKRVKIIGRVSMGMIVIDVTDIAGVSVGDVATLLGKDGEEEVTANELADIAGTVNYEIVTGINPRMKRTVV